MMDALIENITDDEEYIKTFIKEHENSSLGQQIRWGHLIGMTKAERAPLLFAIKEKLIQMRREEGRWLGQAPNLGMRARSDSIPAGWQPGEEISGEMTRTRAVMFTPALSAISVFLPKERRIRVYKKVLDKALSFCPRQFEYHTPLLEGGETYAKLQAELESGYHYYALDGVNWESAVPFLGASFRPWWVGFGGEEHLPSGALITSLIDTAAMIIAMGRLLPREAVLYVLGDDANVVNPTPISGGGKKLEIPGLMEFQAEDTAYQFFLGLGYKPDVTRPRVYGVKLTIDNAERNLPYRLTPDYTYETDPKEPFKGKTTPKELDMWVGLYDGKLGESLLLDVLRRVPAGDWISPGELIAQLLEEQVLLAET